MAARSSWHGSLAALAALLAPQEAGREAPAGLPAELAGALAEQDPAVVALGEELFFDPILSADRGVACASCHDPALGFAANTPVSTGVHGRKTLRNAPTLYNRALGESFMWDGRAATLEEQVLLPIENELEMDLALAEAVQRLAQDPARAQGFQRAFGAPPDEARLASALASYVRTLVYGDSPVDRFRAADFAALDSAARQGLWLYESRGRCWRCHSGPNFTDESFHNTGVGVKAGQPEEGRFAVTGREEDRGRFKTPTLRGLTETAPYMHDGSVATLEDIVAFYRGGGHANPGLDPVLAPLDMSAEDAANLVAFLKALSRAPAEAR